MEHRTHVWEPLLTDRDREFLSSGFYGKKRGFGSKSVLLVVDMQHNACGDKDEHIFDMIKRWPSGCGHEAWKAIANQQKLIASCREANIPIIYTKFIPQLVQFDGFSKKHNKTVVATDPTDKKWQIVEELAPQEGDIILEKSYASVLFGTPLISWLISMGVDTIITVGTSTGGCVRASAIDLITHNFNVVVVEDCTFDRIELSHAAALLDLWMKYCDVMFMDEVLEHLHKEKKVV
jgi:maleamate amidohydrolase